MSVLTLNAGSSSLKYAVFSEDLSDSRRLSAPHIQGQIEQIGPLQSCANHQQAVDAVFRALSDANITINAVGHRVVHGGRHFAGPARIDKETLATIAALAPLAPLHQPHNIAGIEATLKRFPNLPQVASFDTAFHQSRHPLEQRFAIAQTWHDKGIQSYGFHGLSYQSICHQMALDSPELLNRRVVVAHLGNGASMCAIRDAKSVATTMSFSPLDGLIMGTRTGRIDASVALHLIDAHGLTSTEVSTLLNQKSGLLGVSGQSNDMRTLLASTDSNAAFAIEQYIYAAARELAIMANTMQGIDVLVFTGGIGENSEAIRDKIIDAAAWIGVGGPKVTVKVMRTNEEAIIAQQLLDTLA